MARRLPIYHVAFSNYYLMTSTFLRFQEHYESPKFHGKIFTLEEFMDWYAAERGKFSYFEDWGGFNIPGRVFAPFSAGKFDPLTRKEAALLKMFRGVSGDFYVIGSVGGDLEGMLHEIIHGMFYLFPEYRRDAVRCLRGLDDKHIRERLLKMDGYDKSVLDDEVNAYGLTAKSAEPGHKRQNWKIKKALEEVFFKHFGYSVATKNGQKKLISGVHRLKFSWPK